MPLPQIIFKNQFGEETIATVLDSDALIPAAEIATGTVVANLSGDTDFPEAVTLADFSTALAPVIGPDLEDDDITGKLLTGLAAGSATPIAATDTILEALANLQAQIDAL